MESLIYNDEGPGCYEDCPGMLGDCREVHQIVFESASARDLTLYMRLLHARRESACHQAGSAA